MAAREPSTISVVVPTYNRLARLRRVLDALAAQTYPADALEVVVVSDGSSDGTDEYLATLEFPCTLRVARQDNCGPAVARNHGVELATGSRIVFVDDDVIPSPTLVACHAGEHLGDAAVMIGPMLTDPDFDYQPWILWEQQMLYKQYDAMRRGDYAPTFRQFYTGNASMPRELFVRAGGFDTTLRRAEDVELAYRLDQLGATFVFDESAAAFHHAERSYDSWRATAVAYGRNDILFARDHHQDWLMAAMVAEFRTRNVLTRQLTVRCLVHPRRAAFAERALRAMSNTGSSRPAQAIARRALSGIYGLAYYRAAADEFGDPRRFRELLTGRAPLTELGWDG